MSPAVRMSTPEGAWHGMLWCRRISSFQVSAPHLRVKVAHVHRGLLVPVLCMLPDEVGSYASSDAPAGSRHGRGRPETCSGAAISYSGLTTLVSAVHLHYTTDPTTPGNATQHLIWLKNGQVHPLLPLGVTCQRSAVLCLLIVCSRKLAKADHTVCSKQWCLCPLLQLLPPPSALLLPDEGAPGLQLPSCRALPS
jgi:hypothetical protein